MKISVKQLRRIIKEEVEATMAPNGGWSVEKTAASDPKLIAAALPGVLGKPAARPEICGELANAIVAAAKRAVAGEKNSDSLRWSISSKLETTVDPEVPGSKHVVFSATDMDRIMHTFLGVSKPPPRGGNLRNKYPEAFEACDDNTRTGRAERDWIFSEDASPEDDGTTVLWAEPRVSGDSMWWDGRRGLWLEEDGERVW